MDRSIDKRLMKKLNKWNIHTQEDLIGLLVGAISSKWQSDAWLILKWLEEKFPAHSVEYVEPEPELLEAISEYDLAWFVSEADSFLASGHRTVTGSYYTPYEWVNMMVKLSLADYIGTCLDVPSETALSYIAHLAKVTESTPGEASTLEHLTRPPHIELNTRTLHILKRSLEEVRVIDIACGAGAFLLEMIEMLVRLRSAVDLCLGDSSENRNYTAEICSENVYGVDKQLHPLMVYALCLLWRYGLHTYEAFDLAILRADSLSTSIYESKGIQAVTELGGFDIVIGNPPYLGEKGNIDIFKALRKTEFGKAHYEGKMDLSYFFTLRGLDLLKKDGCLTYLTTNYFITADGAVKYRKKLHESSRFKYILNFNTYPVFKDALGQHNMIYMLKKKEKGTRAHDKLRVDYVLSRAHDDRIELDASDLLAGRIEKTYVNAYECDCEEIYNPDGTISVLSDYSHRHALQAYAAFCDSRLRDIFDIKQGIVSGADKVSRSMLNSKISRKTILNTRLEKDMPIFVFGNDTHAYEHIEKGFLKPFYKNSDIDKYIIKPRTKRLIVYIDDYIDEFEKTYPKTYGHLNRFKEVLDQRREVVSGTRPWYGLQWPRKPEVFVGDKIVVPQRSKANRFAYTDIPFYCSADVYYFKEKAIKSGHVSQAPLDRTGWLYYLGILNSAILYLELYHNGKRKGELLELYARPLLETPVPAYKGLPWQKAVSEKVSHIMALMNEREDGGSEKIRALEDAIGKLIFEQMGMDAKTIEIITAFHKRHNTK